MKQKDFVMAGSLELWHEHNADLSVEGHIRAIVWHSNRVGRLEREFLTYDDEDHGQDLWVGMWFEHKATPEQIALAEYQNIVSDAIRLPVFVMIIAVVG